MVEPSGGQAFNAPLIGGEKAPVKIAKSVMSATIFKDFFFKIEYSMEF